MAPDPHGDQDEDEEGEELEAQAHNDNGASQLHVMGAAVIAAPRGSPDGDTDGLDSASDTIQGSL